MPFAVKKKEYPELTLYEQIQKEKCRRSLKEFIKQGWHVVEPATPFVEGWHIDAICEHLLAVTYGEINQLLINVPPRHAKSLVVGVFWPAWTWINKPDTRWLCSSYALSLAIRDNRKCRLLIESDWYQQRWGDKFFMSVDQNAKCLLGSTKLSTEYGDLSIYDIVEKRLDVKILSFNHENGKIENKSILSYDKNPGKSCVRVCCANGSEIVCTTNHPFYVLGKGYVEVKNLKIGDKIYEKNMRSMRKGIYSSGTSKSRKISSSLLQQKMSKSMDSKRNSCFAYLPLLWKIYFYRERRNENKNKEVLRKPLSWEMVRTKLRKIKKRNYLQILFKRISGISRQYRCKVLFLQMLSCGSSLDNKRERSSSLWKRFLNDFYQYSKTRSKMSTLSKHNRFGSSSYRSQQIKQRFKQSDNTFSKMPLSRNSLKRKRDVEETSIIAIIPDISPSYVYNLEIEDNHNFFANDILVHNSRFENNHRGYRLATSVGSAATGEGGDYVLCLDFHTSIATDIGALPIGKIVDEQLDVKILTYDHQTRSYLWRKIEKYEKNPGRLLYRVELWDGTFIDATKEHPFYVIGKGYTKVNSLKYDDLLLHKNGNFVGISSIEEIDTPHFVYNLRIEKEHNYFANNYLVHNCDDPHNAQDMYSDVKREEALLWWDTTMSTRLNNPKKGGKVIIMQRLHQFDLSGHVLEQGGYVQVCLPAEYDPERKCTTSIGWSDPRTVEGQLLWPDQVGKKELEKLQRSLGSVAYAAQFLQSPTPAGGNIFRQEYFVYFTAYEDYFTLHDREEGAKNVARKSCWYFATVDLAISQKSTADYTVIATWAVTPNNELLLVEIIRDRFTGPETQQQIAYCYQKWQHTFIDVEAVAFQAAMVQDLSITWGIPVRGFKPQKDKTSRAISASIFYSNGQVYHQQFAEYLLPLERELLNFPKEAHDDLVDVVSRATEVLFNPNTPNIRGLDDEVDETVVQAQYERGIFDDF